MTFQSSNSNLQVSQEVVERIVAMAPGNIPVFNAAGKLIDSGFPAGPGSAIKSRYLFANLNATAAILPWNRNCNIGLPTQSAAGLGPGLTLDPHLIHSNCVFESVRMTINGGSVLQATVGATPTVRIDFYKVTGSGRTLLVTVRIPFVTGTIGVLTTPTQSFQTSIVIGIATALLAGDLIGAEFVPETANNNNMNSIIDASFIMQTTE